MSGQLPHGKAAKDFRQIKWSLEPTTMDLGVESTPEDRFFVCSVAEAPELDVERWRLDITDGSDGVPVPLSYEQLRALPQHEVHSWLECAGNGRQLFELVGGYDEAKHLADTPWMLGAMGIARWSGPSLRTVLEAAAVSTDRAWLAPTGLDVENVEGEPPRMCLPIEKALHADTIVALDMDGSPLPRAHGWPARLIVPGWVGAYSMKWLDSITLSDDWIPSWRADEYYQRRLPDGTKLGPATAHPVKSSVALEWGAALTPGQQIIHGYARSAGTSIAKVEWSVDGGPWAEAELVGPNGAWTWSPFRFAWDAEPGDHTIRTRATDSSGDTQPETLPFHPNTILWNAITPHPVRVGAA